MSDRFPAEIHIGGLIPRCLVRQLLEVIVAEGAGLDHYGGPMAEAESTRFRLHQGAILSVFNSQAAGGQFAGLEAFLVRYGVHFDRYCDAFQQEDAQHVCHRGGKAAIFPVDHAGELLLRAEDVKTILRQTSVDDHEKLFAIHQMVCPPETLPLAPIRFVP